MREVEKNLYLVTGVSGRRLAGGDYFNSAAVFWTWRPAPGETIVASLPGKLQVDGESVTYVVGLCSPVAGGESYLVAAVDVSDAAIEDLIANGLHSEDPDHWVSAAYGTAATQALRPYASGEEPQEAVFSLERGWWVYRERREASWNLHPLGSLEA